MPAKSKPVLVIISPQAKEDIVAIIIYLKENWQQKTIDEFLLKLQIFYQIISFNPRLFGYYDKSKHIRKYAITKQSIIYYRIKKHTVEVITVFDGRQDQRKLKKIIKANK